MKGVKVSLGGRFDYIFYDDAGVCGRELRKLIANKVRDVQEDDEWSVWLPIWNELRQE